MEDLKLVALDQEDLAVISAHLQDAVIRISDMAYLPAQKRFAAVSNRFNWEKAAHEKNSKSNFERRRTALRLDRVLGAQVQNLRLDDKTGVLELLAIQFELLEDPEGYITLVFSGDSAIRLHVECIEVELKDLGAAWETQTKPEHPTT